MKISMLYFILPFVFINLGQYSYKNPYENIQGEWINTVDKKWELHFKGNDLIELYDCDTLGKYVFSFQEISCDQRYMDTIAKSLFLSYQDDYLMCYEIMGLTVDNLSFRETKTGKLYLFRKNKMKDKK